MNKKVTVILLFTILILNCTVINKKLYSQFKNIDTSEWFEDYGKAYNQALNEQKKVLIIFNGSDWCGNCLKLDDDGAFSGEFEELTKRNFKVVYLNFLRDTAVKESKEELINKKELFERFNPDGYFPYFVIVRAGNLISDKFGFLGTDETLYIERLRKYL